MNYDPIHDTFVGSGDNEQSTQPSNTPGLPSLNHNIQPNTQLNTATFAPQSNTKFPISMQNLMTTNPQQVQSPSNVLAETSVNDDDMDEDEDDLNDNENDQGNDNGSKKPKVKKPVSASIPKGVRYLKKSDGEPFWRKDIQYDFLDALFSNQMRVFTNPFTYCSVLTFHNGPKYTFAELYIRTLAESPKCSKVLKDRLLRDTEMATSVVKVCLLVNTGRMNTTINFVPEMRSSLRTFHSIPSLQADPITGTSKQLQDTPRLKSILKAVSDSKEDYKVIEDLLANPPIKKPNTNLVLLLFLFSNNTNGIKFHHEHTPECRHTTNSFMEFFLETNIHPANRARRLLWLMYTYLETDFSPEQLALNPFNPHVIPPIEYIPDSEVSKFDKDTDYEIEYSERMYVTRLKYLDEDHNSGVKRTKPKKERDDNDDLIDDELSGLRKSDEKPDKKKRKLLMKPSTSPVLQSSSIYDFDRKSAKSNQDAKNVLHFSMPVLRKIMEYNEIDKKENVYNPDFYLSKTNKKELITRIQQSMKNKKVNTEEVQTGLKKFEEWIHKFFQYKKSVGNGLVDMEWEDIRYEIIHGLEDYLYKSHSSNSAFTVGEEKNDNSEFDPLYEYETIGQKSEYIYSLLHKSRKWFEPKEKKQKITIDLSKEEINFTS